MEPGEKKCQWMLGQAEKHAVWDWNFANHTKAINFYRSIVEKNPDTALPYLYLIDNLLADNRADEAQRYLGVYRKLKGANATLVKVYPAYIQLARFNEPEADRIMENILKENPDSDEVLFESAQYYARKCDYERAIELYELSYEKDRRRPRFVDALQGIADICKIQGNYKRAAEAYGRIVDSMINEWGMKDEVELKDAQAERARLLELAK